MKTSTLAFLAFAAPFALMAPSPAAAYESMLDEPGESSQEGHGRRLGSWYRNQDYWRSIYYRCCNTDEGEDATEGSQSKNNEAWRRTDGDADDFPGLCKCPVRGSSYGWGSRGSYFERWQSSCSEGGKIYTRAGI